MIKAIIMRIQGFIFLALLLIASCDRKTVQFGDTPQDAYSLIKQVDTVSVQMSTLILDSFVTSGKSNSLVGRYKDPYFGHIEARSYFQLGKPSQSTVPDIAIYDSLVLIVPLNKYHYGDTTQEQTFYVHELAAPIEPTYSNYLYNTSAIPQQASVLGSRSLVLRPTVTDTIQIRLSDAKGRELFALLQRNSDTLETEEKFLRYFRGLTLGLSGADTTAIYGIQARSGLQMRLHYRTTTPVLETHMIRFSLLENNLRFTQLKAERGGTSLPNASSRVLEIPTSQTNELSYSQSSLGVLGKMSFPTIRNLLHLNRVVRLLKAELVIQPADAGLQNNLKLPNQLYLAETSGANEIGSFVGQSNLREPGISAHYVFNVTSSINSLLNNSGLTDRGFLVLEELPGNTSQVNRLVIGGSAHSKYRTQLKLTLLTVKN